jgi:hypothetical protein
MSGNLLGLLYPCLGDKVLRRKPWFHGFKVSWFQGFRSLGFKLHENRRFCESQEATLKYERGNRFHFARMLTFAYSQVQARAHE